MEKLNGWNMVHAINQQISRTLSRNARLLGWFIFTLLPVSLEAADLDVYPGAELVKSNADPKVTTRRIILGSLKKINNVLEPELLEFVSGSRYSTTYYIPDERRVGKIVEFYKNQLDKSVRILFECSGRDCGSSNYWANTIFQTPILYGPEQYQNYLVGRRIDKGDYVSIYIGQRGTRKIYVHIETTIISIGPKEVDEVSISAALASRGRYVIVLSAGDMEFDSIVDAVAKSMNNNLQMNLTLVAHDNLQNGETVQQGQQRTLRLSESVRSALVSAGIAEDRLSAYGVGPLSPLENEDSPRLELLVIH